MVQSKNNKGVCSFLQTIGPRVGMVLGVGDVRIGVEGLCHSRRQRMGCASADVRVGRGKFAVGEDSCMYSKKRQKHKEWVNKGARKKGW